MSLTQILLEFNIHNSLEDFKQTLENNNVNIEYDVEYYLGSGQNGDAYKVKGKDKVIKVGEYYRDDYELMEKIKEQNNLEYVANVFMNKKIKSENLLLTVMEYLEEPPEDVADIPSNLNWRVLAEIEAVYNGNKYKTQSFERMVRLLKERARDQFYDENYEKFITLLNKIIDEYSDEKILLKCILYAGGAMYATLDYDLHLPYILENKKFFKDVLNGIKEFQSFGEIHNDVKMNNILQDPKTGNYKLIDPWVSNF